MKRSRLKNKSKSQAKLERTNQQARSAFRGEFPRCWFCGVNETTDVHELTATGSCRKRAYGKRCCWGASCNGCNCHELTNKAKWPLARALAKKFIHDRAWFDLEEFNRIRSGLKRVAWPDVVIWICRELDG
jgi:hypothetical protein